MSPRRAAAAKNRPQKDAQGARDAALKLLAGRDLSRRELREALLAKRYKEAEVEQALGALAELGLADDRRTALSHIRRRLAEGPVARALLEAELGARGIESALVAASLTEALVSDDDGRQALDVAREKVRTSPPRLARDAVLRRAFAFLLRRGYDEEVARQAVETAGEEYLGRP
jgi:regulatory protein